MLTGAIIGCVVVLVMMVMNKSKAKAGTGLPGKVEEVLRASGPLNLKDISVKVGKDSFMGRGDVVNALAALQGVGKIKTNPAPAGTPQLKKVDFITYEAVTPPQA
jgi:hypothetical protein